MYYVYRTSQREKKTVPFSLTVRKFKNERHKNIIVPGRIKCSRHLLFINIPVCAYETEKLGVLYGEY